MKRLTKDEQFFLDLPDSKLAIRLYEKKLDSVDRPSLFKRVLGTSKRRVIALSAFIAAIIPLYEINKSAIDFTLKRRDLAASLETAEELIKVDAIAAARSELKKAEKIDESNTKLLHLQSLIELEETLRKRQDIRSLREIEIRYRRILPKFAQSSYLLGTAYINWDLDKASALLDQSERLNQSRNLPLRVRILSARIWVYSRHFQKTGDNSFLEQADNCFEVAEKITNQYSETDFSKDLIPLYHHYSFIAAAREKNEFPDKEYSSEKLSKKAFSTALKTGSHLLISKTAKALAEKRKDSEDKAFSEAKALLNFAIQHAKQSDDDRGLYYGYYTLGQVEHLLANPDESKKAYLRALEGAIAATDYRIEIFSRTALSKVCLVLNESTEAETHTQIAKTLAKETSDTYGEWELEVIDRFGQICEAGSPDFTVLRKSFGDLHLLIPKEFELFRATCELWMEIMLEAENGRLAARPEEFVFDAPLEEFAFERISECLAFSSKK